MKNSKILLLILFLTSTQAKAFLGDGIFTCGIYDSNSPTVMNNLQIDSAYSAADGVFPSISWNNGLDVCTSISSLETEIAQSVQIQELVIQMTSLIGLI